MSVRQALLNVCKCGYCMCVNVCLCVNVVTDCFTFQWKLWSLNAAISYLDCAPEILFGQQCGSAISCCYICLNKAEVGFRAKNNYGCGSERFWLAGKTILG